MANILIADDERSIIKLLRIYLEKEGYTIFEAYDGEMALMIIKNHGIDVALLDIMMPKLNGFELIKKIKQISDIPIMFISAKVDLSNRILGIDLGADDYITKPFEALEVVAKVKARLRKSNARCEQQENIVFQDLKLNIDGYSVYKGEKLINLTKLEFLILKLFISNPRKVFTKEQIYNYAWGDMYVVDDNTIRVVISKLREKIGNNYIKAIRGLGYRLEKNE